jgi:hypothetical protein
MQPRLAQSGINSVALVVVFTYNHQDFATN